MSKILITGMTSTQASEKLNSKSKNFAGVLSDVLKSDSHEVTWAVPKVEMTLEDLSQFDSVLVGVSPLGGLSANYSYGALNLINLLWSSGKLSLFIDAPNASQIEPNLKSTIGTPESFVKPFFSKRIGYPTVTTNPQLLSRLVATVYWLANEPWPTTIYPKLPWRVHNDIKLPPNAKKNLHGLNLDSFYLGSLEQIERNEEWVTDDPSNKWSAQTQKLLSRPVAPLASLKTHTDVDIQERLLTSLGALLAPNNRNGTWWSHRISQALSANTPIATDWKESQNLGSPWSVLPATIESLGPTQRYLLALAQRELYEAAIETKAEALNKLKSILKVG